VLDQFEEWCNKQTKYRAHMVHNWENVCVREQLI
jgi:hypothetical protein